MSVYSDLYVTSTVIRLKIEVAYLLIKEGWIFSDSVFMIDVNRIIYVPTF